MKKNVFLPILLALLAFGQTAWAQQTNVNYIDANGEPQTASAYLITSSNTTLGMQGYDIWYYVEGNQYQLDSMRWCKPDRQLHR